jgi:hypothetical protein
MICQGRYPKRASGRNSRTCWRRYTSTPASVCEMLFFFAAFACVPKTCSKQLRKMLTSVSAVWATSAGFTIAADEITQVELLVHSVLLSLVQSCVCLCSYLIQLCRFVPLRPTLHPSWARTCRLQVQHCERARNCFV